ncbi:MAG: undecaprenyl diphosphate synthase family protein [Clostridia bacterium]|nr:undecaprenyl diphosphate synthase family protein [Clostridia bacterium]
MKINHLGIIPDGNRRWAKANNVDLYKTYNIFANRIVEIFEFFQTTQINELTVYIASKENLTRKPTEIDSVVNAFVSSLPAIKDIALKNNCKVKFIGLYNVTHQNLLDCAYDIQNSTQNNTGKVLNMLVGYNPFDEIARSAKAKNSAELEVSDLEVNSYVDLVIRTAGKPVRISNFLPIQCGYANIEVFDKYFIDLTNEEIASTVHSYEDVSPRYGK